MAARALLLLALVLTERATCADVNVDIGVVVALTRAGGEQRASTLTRLTAARLAADTINDSDDMLPGYTVRFRVFDSQSSQSTALLRTLDLCEDYSIPLIVGYGSSSRAEAGALVAGADHCKIPLVSYAATSPSLSNRESYPTFVRTIPSDTQQTFGLASILVHFNWTEIVIVASMDSYGAGAAEALASYAVDMGITVADTVRFKVLTPSSAVEVASEIAHTRKRAFVLFGTSVPDIQLLVEAAHGAGMMESGYVWLASETAMASEVWEGRADLRAVMHGFIGTRPTKGYGPGAVAFRALWATKGDLGNITSPYYVDDLQDTSVYNFYLHDAMLLAGAALHRVVTSGEHVANRTAGLAALNAVTVNGATGRFSLSDGERAGIYEVINIQSGTVVVVGDIVPGEPNALQLSPGIVFLGNASRAPSLVAGTIAGEECFRGYYYNKELDRCLSCPSGLVALKTKQRECVPCPEGYVPSREADSCVLCPAGRWTEPRSATCDLMCDKLSYRPDNSTDGCAQCPPNHGTEIRGATRRSDCVCLSGYFLAGGECQSCPHGASCAGGAAPPLALPSFWSSAADPTRFLLCPDSHTCPGGSPHTCAEFHAGPLCGQCVLGAYKTNGVCLNCGNFGHLPFTSAVVAVAIFSVVVIVWVKCGPTHDLMKYHPAMVVLSIGIDFVQLVGVLKSISGWPTTFQSILDAVSVFNLNMEHLRLECIFGHVPYGGIFAAKMLTPAALGFLFLLMVVASSGRARLLFIGAFLQFVKFVYIALVSAISDIFLCYQQPSSPSHWHLRSDPSIVCFRGATWLTLVPPAIFATLIYALLVPSVFAVLILYWDYFAARFPSFESQFALPLGRFSYRVHTPYWLLVILFRRFVVGFLVPSLGPRLSESAPFEQDRLVVSLYTMAFAFFLLAHAYMQPYRWKYCNVLESQLILAVILILLFFSGVGSSYDIAAFLIAIFCLSLAAIVIVFYLAFADIRQLEPPEGCNLVVAFAKDHGFTERDARDWFQHLPPEDANVILRASDLLANHQSVEVTSESQSAEEEEAVSLVPEGTGSVLGQIVQTAKHIEKSKDWRDESQSSLRNSTVLQSSLRNSAVLPPLRTIREPLAARGKDGPPRRRSQS